MPNVRGIIGFNRSGTSDNVILVAFGNDLVNITTGLGYGLGIQTSNDVDLETFLDRVFFQNNSNVPITFDGTTWSRQYVGRVMTAKYQKRWQSRMYLGNCSFTAPQAPQDPSGTAITFPSRVFFSDLFSGNTLTWGLEWGRNGRTYANTNVFEVSQADAPLVQDFKANNIKVGDPLFITNGSATLTGERPYLVTSIPSSYRLLVDRNFPVTTTGQHFWVGSNWFDVATDDNDQITGFGENAGRLLNFKLASLHYYTGNQLIAVRGAKGTSYNRSILNDSAGNTYYFHGSNPKLAGIYKFNGVYSVKISRAIDPFILGMNQANYDNVVGWPEGNELRWWIGDLTNNNYDIDMDNAVATLNLDTNSWSVDPIADSITASTVYRSAQVENSYGGTSDSQVIKFDEGNTFITTDIGATLETKVYYPAGTEIICEFPTVQVIATNSRGTRVKYKLWDKPEEVDTVWHALGELSGDKTEFTLPPDHRWASGIQFKFDEISSRESDTMIEKISLFYKPDRSRLL